MKYRIKQLWWMLLSFSPILSGCGPLGDLGKSLGDMFKDFKLP